MGAERSNSGGYRTDAWNRELSQQLKESIGVNELSQPIEGEQKARQPDKSTQRHVQEIAVSCACHETKKTLDDHSENDECHWHQEKDDDKALILITGNADQTHEYPRTYKIRNDSRDEY